MNVIVLGSGTGMPMPDRNPPGFLVNAAGTLLLLDCGSGTLQRLARAGVHPKMLDGIFLSHAHLDHTSDLLPLLFSLRLPGCELDEDLPLYTGPNFKPIFKGLEGVYGDWIKPKGANLFHQELTQGRFEVGALLCRVAQLEHHETSIGIQIEDPNGGRLAYLGDTDLCDGAILLCKGVDLAIIECSMPDEHEMKGHMTPKKIAQLAAEAKPQAILLHHLYPPMLEIDPIEAIRAHGCDIPITVAADGFGVSIE